MRTWCIQIIYDLIKDELTKKSCSVSIVKRLHGFLMNFSCYSIPSGCGSMRNVRHRINNLRNLKKEFSLSQYRLVTHWEFLGWFQTWPTGHYSWFDWHWSGNGQHMNFGFWKKILAQIKADYVYVHFDKVIKVHIFKEDHENWQNLHHGFDIYYIAANWRWRFIY